MNTRPPGEANRAGNAGRDPAFGRDLLLGLFPDHVGLLLTLIYLLVTTMGLMYSFWLYARFRIWILDYAQTSDFLLAALKAPLVVVLCLAPIPIAWLFHRADRWARVRFPRGYRLAGGFAFDDHPGWRRASWVAFVLVYAFYFTGLYARRVADDIQAGRGRRVDVELQSGTPSRLEGGLLVGTTSLFAFVHLPSEHVTHVVPIENLARIVVAGRDARLPGAGPASMFPAAKHVEDSSRTR